MTTKTPLTVTIKGTTWNKTTLAKHCGIKPDSALWRIKQYTSGKINEQELLTHTNTYKSSNKRTLFATIGTQQWTPESLAQYCGLKLPAARRRLSRFMKGQIGERQLFNLHKPDWTSQSEHESLRRTEPLSGGIEEITTETWRNKRDHLMRQTDTSAAQLFGKALDSNLHA